MMQTDANAAMDTDDQTSVRRASRLRAAAGILLLLAAALLYAFTLDNGLQPGELHGGDLITHQYAQVQARPSNAPGYPLYTMGGWLWFHAIRNTFAAVRNTQPNPIPILSSYSTLWALLALWLLYEVICLVTKPGARAGPAKPASVWYAAGNWPLAFVVSAFYAVTYFFWYYATTTEQYSSAIAQTLAIVFVFLLWLGRRENLWLLFALAFLCGLSLAHMLTVAFIVPPVAAAVLRAKPELLRSGKAVAGSVLAALLPLTGYLFVYVRGSQHPEWWGSQAYSSASNWFWSFISTSQGREELMWAFEPGRPFLGNGFPSLIGQELTWTIVVTGLVGIAFLRNPLPFVLYATLVTYLLFSWTYRFGNWFQVILPAYALILIGVAAAADRWQSFARARFMRNGDGLSSARGLARASAVAAPVILLTITVVWRFDASLTAANSRNRPGDTALDRAAVLINASLPPASALFAPVDDALALQYLTDIWHTRSDVTVVSSDEARTLVRQQPVYSTWDAASMLRDELGLPDGPAAVVVSPDWVALSMPGERTAAEDPSAPGKERYLELMRSVSPQIRLAGYELDRAPDGSPVVEETPPAYDVTLYWQLLKDEWPQDLAISVRPTLDNQYVADPANPAAVLATDHDRPAQLQFDDGAPAPDGLLADPYRVKFPSEFGPSQPGIAVVLYRRVAEGFEDVARLDIPVDDSLVTN